MYIYVYMCVKEYCINKRNLPMKRKVCVCVCEYVSACDIYIIVFY